MLHSTSVATRDASVAVLLQKSSGHHSSWRPTLEEDDEAPTSTSRSFANAVSSKNSSGTASIDTIVPSVIRITSVVSTNSIYTPWDTTTATQQSIGSGLIIRKDPIVIVTNAHVVSNAFIVSVELPSIDRTKFDAQVRVISHDFDVALLTLTDETKLHARASAANVDITPMTLSDRDHMCPLAAKVMALGFSLGGIDPKLSEGVISGTDVGFSNNVVCSQTAPISPGNSGGPLLFEDDMTVAGLNFASDTQGQNLNLVVPSLRVRQMLDQLDLASTSPVVQPSISKGQVQLLAGKHPLSHTQVRLPSVELLTEETTGALAAYSNCENGIYVVKIEQSSVFTAAVPQLPSSFSLLAVDGIAIDSYGEGRMPMYVNDPVHFSRMLTLRRNITDNATIVVCTNGINSTHILPLAWQDRFETPIPALLEPSFSKLDYELFAGVGIMQLTQTHLSDLIVSESFISLSRFELDEFKHSSWLFISFVAPGTDADKALSKGMILDSVNGHKVRDLQSFREHFIPDNGSYFILKSDRDALFVTNFTKELALQKKYIDEGVEYMLTPAINRTMSLLSSNSD